MTPEQWAKLDDLFEQAAALPAAQREPFVRDRARGDDTVRDELLSLLEQTPRVESFLADPIVPAGTFAGQAEHDPLLGRRLASYQVVERIGAGGMGVVYRAIQDSPQRTVALKVIRPGAISASMLRRFQHEADTLGRLQHPGIAQIYESGHGQTPLGVQPFFAMEFVEGRPLLDYVRETSPSIRARLELLARVCDAVQHAHTKGVIHRDLKPGNILVDVHGQPKILDFGIARLIDSDIQVTTLRTDIGQLIGTLPYMSPEQATGKSDELDTRSDVYALGVVLYELLCGRLPYELRDRPVPEALRVISEQDPTRLSAVSRVFRGDIETIVAKALEKDKARRYQSAADLAADIRRFLSDQAIAARPSSTIYQLRKFARRNRALVGGIAAAFVLLVAGVIGTTSGMLKARASQRLAERREEQARIEARKASKAIEFLVQMLTSAAPEESEGREVTVRELLDKAAGKVDTELADEPEVQETIESAIGRTFEAIGKTDRAKEHLETATALSRRIHGEGSAAEGLALLHEASLAAHERRWPDGEGIARRAVAILGTLPDHQARAADAYGALGLALAGQRKNDEAIPALRESLSRFAAAGLGESEGAAEVMQNLGVTLGRKGGAAELTEGEAVLKRAMELRRVINGPTNPNYAGAVHYLASFYYTQSRSADARPLYEESLAILTRSYGAQDRRTLEIVSSLGRTYMQLGDLDKAEAFGLRALEGFKATGQAETAEAAAAMSRLASLYVRRKNYDEAERYNRDALALRRKLGHVDTPVSLVAVADVLTATGRNEEAIGLYREAVDIERKRGFPRADAAGYIAALAQALQKADRAAEAEAVFREAIAFGRERMPGHQQRAMIELQYAVMLLKQRRPAEAVEPARNACEIYRALHRDDRLTESMGTLAKALDESGQAGEAARVRQELSNIAPPAAKPAGP